MPLEFRGLRGNLNLPNRRMRTRMSGGVGGEQRANPLPPIPIEKNEFWLPT
jgi:hypothetical protein